jgi:competence protein ComEC
MTSFPSVNPFRIIGDLFASERERWLLWTPVGIGLGIVAYFALPFEPVLWALAASPVVALAMFLCGATGRWF